MQNPIGEAHASCESILDQQLNGQVFETIESVTELHGNCALEGTSLIKDEKNTDNDDKSLFTRSKRKVIYLKGFSSINKRNMSENDCYSTKIETTLSDKNLIPQLRTFCDLAAINGVEYKNDNPFFAVHHLEESNMDPLNKNHDDTTRKSSKDEIFLMQEDSCAFNVRQSGTFVCWVCLGKFMNCVDVKKHIIENHSQGLCTYAQWEEEKMEMQSQLLLFCPNQCTYVSSQLNNFLFHMITCRNPAQIFMGTNMVEVQRDFISYEYFQLYRDQFIMKGNQNTLKEQELHNEHCLEDDNSAEDQFKKCEDGKQKELMKKTWQGNKTSDNLITEVMAGSDVYECNSCRLVFSTKLLLDNHLQNCFIGQLPNNVHSRDMENEDKPISYHGQDIYECDSCRLVFSTKLLLENHLKTCFVDKIPSIINKCKKIQEKSLRCHECGKDFDDNASFEKHIKGHVSGRSFGCNETFKTSKRDSHGGSDLQVENKIPVDDKYKGIDNDRHVELYSDENSLAVQIEKQNKEKCFKCNKCGKTFHFKESLVTHLKEHGKVKPCKFKCNECSETFRRKEYLESHMQKHSKERLKAFKCNKCGKSFSQKRYLVCHLKVHFKENNFKCIECGKIYKYRTSLLSHMKIHNEEMAFTCRFCRRHFSRRSHLLDHLRTQHKDEIPSVSNECDTLYNSNSEVQSVEYSDKRPSGFDESESDLHDRNTFEPLGNRVVCSKTKAVSLQCNDCNKTFLSHSLLKRHMKVHGEKQFKCNDCGKSFRVKCKFEDHTRTHSGEKPFKCHLCEKCFRTRSNLNVHVKRHNDNERFLCNECGKTFHLLCSLRLHMKIHSDEKPYQCTICNYRCRGGGNLKQHMRTHTGEKPFKCKICGVQLAKGYYHMKKHHGEKLFQCKECGAKFWVKAALKNHMRTHTLEKPYQCSECGNTFRDSGSLRTHMMRHRGEKPHKCPFCSKGFVNKSHLTSHIRVHTGEKPYKCDICDMRFNQNVSRRMHMKKHTDEERHLKMSS